MKRIIFTLIFTAAAWGLAAQNDAAVVKTKSVALYPDDSGEGFSINVSGLVIGFGKTKNPSPPEDAASTTSPVKIDKLKIIAVAPEFEIGFNYLLTPDYSLYAEGTKEFLDLYTGKSIHFGWSPIVVKSSFNRKNTLGFTSGLTLVWSNYAFSDRKMTVAKENGMLVPLQIEGNPKKSKLTSFALHIPLLLTMTEPRSKIGVGLGGYVDFVMGSHTKYKPPKRKDRGNFYVEPVQFGLQARVRYRTVGIFANYGLVDMFQKDKAPATRPFTVGFGFGF